MFFKKKGGAMLAAGDTAPDFALPDHNGKTVKLSDFKGKRLIIWFYPKASTGGCTMEGKGFRDRMSQINRAGTIVGVSFDTPAENKAFADANNFSYPLLCDTTRAMSIAYGACADGSAKYPERITYVVDEHGKIEFAEKVTDIPAHVDTAVARLCDM